MGYFHKKLEIMQLFLKNTFQGFALHKLHVFSVPMSNVDLAQCHNKYSNVEEIIKCHEKLNAEEIIRYCNI